MANGMTSPRSSVKTTNFDPVRDPAEQALVLQTQTEPLMLAPTQSGIVNDASQPENPVLPVMLIWISGPPIVGPSPYM